MGNFQTPRNGLYLDRGLGKEFVLLQGKHSSGWVNSQAPDLPFLCWISQDYLDDRVFTFDVDFVSKCCSFTEACTHFLPDHFKHQLNGYWTGFSSLFWGFYIDLCLLVTYSGNHFKKAVTSVTKDAQSKAMKLTRKVILNRQLLAAPLNQDTGFGIHDITCYSEIQVTVYLLVCAPYYTSNTLKGALRCLMCGF